MVEQPIFIAGASCVAKAPHRVARNGHTSHARRFQAISLDFDEDDVCVGRTRVLADVRLGTVPDDFVRRFFDVYSAASDS